MVMITYQGTGLRVDALIRVDSVEYFHCDLLMMVIYW